MCNDTNDRFVSITGGNRTEKKEGTQRRIMTTSSCFSNSGPCNIVQISKTTGYITVNYHNRTCLTEATLLNAMVNYMEVQFYCFIHTSCGPQAYKYPGSRCTLLYLSHDQSASTQQHRYHNCT